MNNIQVFADAEAVSRAAADLFTGLARSAAAQGRCSVSLSGGSTPKRVFELLAQPPWRDQVPWQSVHMFWGDERCVPADDPRSNYRMTRLALLDHVPIPADQVHPIDGAMPPRRAADEYEQLLRQFFGQQAPRFDFVMLGLGENGHTASLFPGTPVLHETERWAAEVYVAEQDMDRVTLTTPLFNQAKTTAFLVTGAGKAAVLHEVIEGKSDPERLPAQLIQPKPGELRWLVDRAASAALQCVGERGV